MSSNKEEAKDRKIIEKLYQAVRKFKEYQGLLGFLNSLVENISSSDTAREFIRPYAPSLQNRFKKSGEKMIYFKELSELHDGQTVTLLKAYVYLGLFETAVTNTIDLILMFFISLDHDFYVPWKREYAKKLEDLDSAFLAEKLAFLNKHNLQFFTRNINKYLKNKMAHMEFDIEPDGRISVGSQRYDLEREIYGLMVFMLTVTAAMEDSGVPKLLSELLD